MPKIVKFENGDGTIGVIIPTPEFIAKQGGDEQKAAEAERDRRLPAGATTIEIAEDSTLPVRTFRNQWENNAGTVETNIPAARTEHLTRMRAARVAKFTEEDANFQAAADTAAEDVVEARRVILRDLPNSSSFKTAVDAATTEATIDTEWPKELDVRT